MSSSLSRLLIHLGEFDGTRTEPLQRAVDDGVPGPEAWARLAGLFVSDDLLESQAASWVVKGWLEKGHPIPAEAVEILEGHLDRIADAWTRQHLCQSLRHLGLADAPATSIDRWVGAIEAWRKEPRPFLRAWATDALYRLAEAHPELKERAATALREAFEDPAASVRARARRIQAGR